jgi:hypothetical protein
MRRIPRERSSAVRRIGRTAEKWSPTALSRAVIGPLSGARIARAPFNSDAECGPPCGMPYFALSKWLKAILRPAAGRCPCLGSCLEVPRVPRPAPGTRPGRRSYLVRGWPPGAGQYAGVPSAIRLPAQGGASARTRRVCRSRSSPAAIRRIRRNSARRSAWPR